MAEWEPGWARESQTDVQDTTAPVSPSSPGSQEVAVNTERWRCIKF